MFGVSDGLVSNVGLILGVAGAATDPSLVRVAGIAGLLSGAISMAAGEYNSMRVQADLFAREVAQERQEIRRNPQVETAELAQLYQSRGVEPDAARAVAESVMADEDLAVATHAREELGIDPDELGSAPAAAGASFVAFTVGAAIPLAPWFVGSGSGATIASLVLAMMAAVVIGLVVARFTDRPRVRAVARQLLFTAVPAMLTYAIGSAIGITV